MVQVIPLGEWTSPDGITWTSRTPVPNGWTSVTYGSAGYVAVSACCGVGNRAMVSSDGINWAPDNTTGFDREWLAVAYGNGHYVGVRQFCVQNCAMVSTDGLTWTGSGNSVGFFADGLAYGAGLFVAVDRGALTGSRAMTSPDGYVRTLRSTPADNAWRDVAYGNGTFVAVASSGTGNRVMTSS